MSNIHLEFLYCTCKDVLYTVSPGIMEIYCRGGGGGRSRL